MRHRVCQDNYVKELLLKFFILLTYNVYKDIIKKKERKTKEKMRREKGITLIALVVTIIILIILGGVSINLVLGNNGIVTKAKLAKKQTEQAKLNEEELLNDVADYIETLGEYTYNNPYIPNGFIHTEGKWNNGYTIKGVTQNVNDEFVWVPCVTEQTQVKAEDTVVTFGKITTGKYNEANLKLLPIDTEVEAEDSSVNEIRKSVKKYGGFYIAKYEAGINGIIDNNSLRTKTPITEKPLSQEGKGVWNSISRADAITVSKAMIDPEATGVKSTLISGEAWDTTLQWMVNASENKDNEPNKNYDINPEGKGWYADVSSGTIHTTGYYPVNNIYDMAGNMEEWTTENCIYSNINYIVARGGRFEFSASTDSVTSRCARTEGVKRHNGFRVVLYK